jgi:hypothetical protein
MQTPTTEMKGSPPTTALWALCMSGLLAACTVESGGDDATASFGTGSQSTTMMTGDTLGDTGTDEDTGTTSDTGTDSSTSSSDSSSTDSSDSEDTMAFVPSTDTTGGGGGAYAPCNGGMCEGGEACLEGEGPNMGKSYCAANCNPPDNPDNCPDAPNGDATPMCISVMGTSYCALDCSGGESCPNGMSCVDETHDNGAIKICL